MPRFLIVALLFLFSCSQPEPEAVKKPDDLIPEEQMVQVIADVHLLEAALNVRTPQVVRPAGPFPKTLEVPRDTLIKAVIVDPNAPPPIGWYDIFKKHGITKERYETSMAWYSAQPEKLNSLYDKVITELTTRQLKK
ncbi:MAG: DUF4296 domain-containing protein [Bacteroidota bacterium]|nr:DUF4296 domain-containing protein [Bacteroidota bacterium]